jgi:N,N'-diacetyllegionaminate synthase
MKAKIENQEINQKKNGTFIVLEAGPTIYNLESAKKLVDLAKDACANAIKFQLLYPDRLMADKNIEFTYKALKKINGKEIFYDVNEPLYNILKRRELKKEEWIELKRYCDEKQIIMFSTATYKDEVDFLVDELKTNSIKINSSDINELEFIRYCASKGINIQLDTGNADLWEIERAVIEAENEGCKNIIIHLCPTGYPARIKSINLNMIKTLKKMFPNFSIAFSDHSPGWNMDIAAVALGVDMIEKTITLDRTIKSCEHSFSLELEDAKRFVKSIREVEIALGNSRRVIPKEIKEKRKISRRSPYALKELKKGDVIKKEYFEFKRPGFGITSDEFYYFIGKKILKDIKKNEALTYDFI